MIGDRDEGCFLCFYGSLLSKNIALNPLTIEAKYMCKETIFSACNRN